MKAGESSGAFSASERPTSAGNADCYAVFEYI